jgi:hypothetical protein
MKRSLLLLLALPLTGCLAEVLTTTAIQGQMQAQQMKGMKRQIEHAQGFAGETELRSAINAYMADKGVYPPSLDVLAPTYIATIPNKANGTPYGYDPASGTLLDSPVAQPTGTDFAQLDATRNAIQQFGADTTWYPNTLADLVPKYLPAVPTTADGQQFIYDNQSGQVFLPNAQPAVAAPPAAAPSYGGSGALAETTTAIGISQDLNNMSNAGANAARSRATSQPVGGDYSDRQMKAADELGL